MKCPQCLTDNLPDSRFCNKCATPLVEGATPTKAFSEAGPYTKTLQMPLIALTRGTLFAGRYEVIEELGRGGMGRVYKVFDQKIKEIVALKLINPEIGFNEKAIERFRNELRFARKISHRHVCRLHDLGEEGYTHFITMEYVDGEDLKRFVRKSGQLTPGKAVSIARQVGEGLAEAHRLGVVHRDLKPQNIMIDRDGNIRIMDFGIARFHEVDGITGSGIIVGTPEYISPEQSELRDVDGRSDIYSLGVILFEMVTGRVPFEGETPLSIAMKHKSQAPRNPQELNPLVSTDLAGIIIKCLEKDRNKRFQNAGELLMALERVEKGMSTVERVAPRVSSPRKKYLLPALVIIVLGVLLIAITQINRQGAVPPRHSSESEKLPLPSNPPVLFPESAAPQESGAGLKGKNETESKSKPSTDVWGILIKEIPKYLSQNDLRGVEDGAQFLEKIKEKLPEGSSIAEAWNKTYQKFKQGEQLNKEGKVEDARKSNAEVQVEMKKLMSLVAQRQSAQEAKAKMNEARMQTQRNGLDSKNLLFRLAAHEERSADEAFAKNDFAGAAVLYRILERSYRLGVQYSSDETCVRGLREMTRQLKPGQMKTLEADPWLSEYASQIEGQADAYFEKKEFENAAASYIQAAFLYEKMKEK
jgi:serine/threonine protein kinase